MGKRDGIRSSNTVTKYNIEYVDKQIPFVKRLFKQGYSKSFIFTQLSILLPHTGDDILNNLISHVELTK